MSAESVEAARHGARTLVQVMHHLPDARGRHYTWNEDTRVIGISVEMFSVVRAIAGVVTGPTLATSRPRPLARGYRPTVNDLGLLRPRG